MIRIYVLDGKMMDSRESLHAHLYMQFGLPPYYGNNLDAFWDCINEKEPGYIMIQNAEYAAKRSFLPLLGLLFDLAERNPKWHISVETGKPDCESCPGGNCEECGGCPEADLPGTDGEQPE